MAECPRLWGEAVGPVKREGIASIGAVVLAFLAGQHHNLHMLLLALGLGSAGMTFIQAYPVIRRGMLLLSLAMVVLNVRSLGRRTMSPGMRVAVVVFNALALGAIVWSLRTFGLGGSVQ